MRTDWASVAASNVIIGRISAFLGRENGLPRVEQGQCRQPVQPRCEDDGDDRSHDELRQRNHRDEGTRDEVVGDPPGSDSEPCSEQDGEHDEDDRRGASEDEAVLQRCRDDRRDTCPRRIGIVTLDADRPRSPCTKLPSQVTYGSGIERSSPSSWRRFASATGDASRPSTAFAGSPGSTPVATKISIDAMSRLTTPSPTRRAT